MTEAIRLKPYHSLRNRLLLLLLGTTVIAAVLIVGITIYVTQTSGRNAQQISGQALIDQAEGYLIQLTESNARENDLILNGILRDTQKVASYTASIYGNQEVFSNDSFWIIEEHMHYGSEGQFANRLDDITSVFVPNTRTVDQETIDDIRLGGSLELIFKSTLENTPNIEAIYFGTPQDVVRYFPNVGLGDVLPPDFQASQRPWYQGSTLENNPERNPWWTPPYVDATGLGLVTTAAMPVYSPHGSFIGVIGLDMTLNEMIATIEKTRFLESGYSFLIDGNGHAIALPDQGFYDIMGRHPEPDEFYADLTTTDTEFAPILANMMAGKSGFDSIDPDGRELYIAYAPLESTGWSLGSVIQSNDVLKVITPLQEELGKTTGSLLITFVLPASLALLTLAIVIGLLFTNRTVRPIQNLAETVQKIGAGHWDVQIPRASTYEINILSDAFESMRGQIHDLVTQLERRVSERTRDLERRSLQMQVAAEVARDATSTRNLSELLENSVTLIRGRFGFYHTGIFLLDENEEYAVLRAGTGEAGRKMIANGHKLRVNKPGLHINSTEPSGLVGTATSTGQPRIALEVGTDAAHYKNPLLPETRSEMVVPLKVGDRVIGALDVQSQYPNAFNEDDITTLQIIADQLAVAIQSADLLEEVQSNLMELENIYSQYASNEWRKLSHSSSIIGYQYDKTSSTPIQSDFREDDLLDDPKSQAVKVPLQVRGVTIGELDVWFEADRVSPDDMALIESISSRLSQAMESARLFEDTQRRAAREKLASEITTKVRASNDPQTILQTAVLELHKALKANRAQVILHQTQSYPKDINNGGNGHELDKKNEISE